MHAPGNRTFICSVLFLDIVGYAHKPVTEQAKLKEAFNALLAEAIQAVPASDRIVLDTDSGAAVSFIGNPEDALTVAIALRDGLAAHLAADAAAALEVRFGINLGPVKLIRDINGQPNLIGDGINVAQRIMAFAEAGQVLVSRSYYEVISRLSEAHARLFEYLGPRTDAHVRTHEVYALRGATATAPREQADADDGLRALQRAGRDAAEKPSAESSFASWRLRLGVPLVVAAIIFGALALRDGRAPAEKSVSNEPPLTAGGMDPYAPEPAPAPISPRPAVSERPREALRSAEPTSVAPQPPAKPKPPSAVPEAPRPAEQKRTAPTPPAVPQSPPSAEPQAAHIELAIAPWGEVYVDGKLKGVSPPLQKLDVAPGTYEIEVRNSTLPVYRQTVRVEAGDRVKIKHKFP